MTENLVRRHAQEIRQAIEANTLNAKQRVVRNRVLDGKIPILWAVLEKLARSWVDGLNAEFHGTARKHLDYVPADGATVPRPGFKIRRGHFPAVFVTVCLNQAGRVIEVTTEGTASQNDPVEPVMEARYSLSLDDQDNVVVQNGSVWTVEELLERSVRPIVQALGC